MATKTDYYTERLENHINWIIDIINTKGTQIIANESKRWKFSKLKIGKSKRDAWRKDEHFSLANITVQGRDRVEGKINIKPSRKWKGNREFSIITVTAN